MPTLMAVGDVFYPDLAQAELGTGLSVITTVNAGRTALQITMIVCNFSLFDTGYDLAIRLNGAGASNAQLIRGSASASAGRLRAGNTEVWRLHIRPGSEADILAKKEAALGDISITISLAEVENA